MPAVHRVEGEVGAGDRIRSAIEARLLSLGYGGLRILTDLSEADLDDELEVMVECEREHMPSKGTVVTRNGGIVDVRLSSASQSFP